MYMILYLCIYRLYIKTFGAIRRERTTGNEFLKWGRTKWRENEFLIWLLYCSTQCITSKDRHTHMYLTMWNYMAIEKYATKNMVRIVTVTWSNGSMLVTKHIENFRILIWLIILSTTSSPRFSQHVQTFSHRHQFSWDNFCFRKLSIFIADWFICRLV